MSANGAASHADPRSVTSSLKAPAYPKTLSARTGAYRKKWKWTPRSRAGRVHKRMPGRDEMHRVSAGRDAMGDRFHEGADRVAGKARVRRGDHDDGKGHCRGRGQGQGQRAEGEGQRAKVKGRGPHYCRRSPRIIRRQGIASDSRRSLRESFDCPCWRSTKMIGTSQIRHPARTASHSISTWNA